ncbi:MAG: hypothetical protein ACREQI_15085 [Candidatus Binataceae bacterium]
METKPSGQHQQRNREHPRCERSNRYAVYHAQRMLIVPTGCNRWRCPACNKYKARKVARRFSQASWTKLITLTLPPGHGWAKRPNIKYQAAALHRFWTALHRYFGTFNTAWVREVGEQKGCLCQRTPWLDSDGEHELMDCICGAWGERLHIHALVNIEPWISPQLLNRLAKNAGLGFVDVRAIRGGSPEVQNYVLKYLTKRPAAFPRFTRRYNTNLPKLTPQPGWRWTGDLHLTAETLYLKTIRLTHDAGLDVEQLHLTAALDGTGPPPPGSIYDTVHVAG